jgi:hypothetical protein
VFAFHGFELVSSVDSSRADERNTAVWARVARRSDLVTCHTGWAHGHVYMYARKTSSQIASPRALAVPRGGLLRRAVNRTCCE